MFECFQQRRPYTDQQEYVVASDNLFDFSEILVGLSLFDDRIGADLKTNLQLDKSTNSVKHLD